MLCCGTRALRKPKRLGGCVQSHSLRVPTPGIPPPTTLLRCDGFPTSPRPQAPAAPSALLTASDFTPCPPSKLSLGHLHIYFTLQWQGTNPPWYLEGGGNTAMKELPVLCMWKYLPYYMKRDIKLLFNLLFFLFLLVFAEMIEALIQLAPTLVSTATWCAVSIQVVSRAPLSQDHRPD